MANMNDNTPVDGQGFDYNFMQCADFFDFNSAGPTLPLDGDNEGINPSNLTMPADFDNSFNGFSAPQEVVSAQPTQPMPMNIEMGPMYHPAVGWYYHASGPPTAPQAAPAMVPLAGMMPVPSFTTSAMPSGTSTPVSGPANPPATARPKHTRTQNKRKYGPSAFLEARAEGRNSVGNDEANYFASRASRRDGGGPNSPVKSVDRAFMRNVTRPSIVQACICEDQHVGRIKRPKNAFILFRAQNADAIRKNLNTKSNQDVSRTAGEMWRQQPESVVKHFKALAEAEKKRHEEKYPTYKYQPGGKQRTKFGKQGCTCGAYELNSARFRERRGLPAGAVVSSEDVADSDAEDAYFPSRSRPAGRAPTAVMMPPPALDIASLGLTARQQAEAQAVHAGMKRRHDLTISTGREADGPIAKRRSNRLNSTAVNYAEPSDNPEDDLFDFNGGADMSVGDMEALWDFNATGTKSQRSPLFVSSPPAKNTRFRSRSPMADDLFDDEIFVTQMAKSVRKGSKVSSGPKSAMSTRSQARAMAAATRRSSRARK